MKNFTKRMMSAFLALVLVLTLFPAVGYAVTTAELSIPVITVNQSSELQKVSALFLSTENMPVASFATETVPRADAGSGYIKIDKTACYFSVDEKCTATALRQAFSSPTGVDLTYDNELEQYILFTYGVTIQPDTPVGTYYIDVKVMMIRDEHGEEFTYSPNNLSIQVNVVEESCAHTTTKTYAKAATCTKPGNTAYYTCTLCGLYFADAEATEEIAKDSWILPALGHDYVNHAAKAATCTEVGWGAYRTCTRCAFSTYVEVPKLGHDMITDVAVAPTCTTAGKTEGSHCSRCDYAVAQQTIAALGHDMIIDPAVAATCTTAGKTEGSHCSRCDYAIAQQNVSALGHDMITDLAVAATCTTAGKTEGSHCSRCDYAVAQQNVPALGHDMIIDPAVAATCTTAGKTEGSHCSRCDYVVAQQNVPALGHDMIIDPAVAATCTAGGKTEGGHCSRCDYTVAQQDVPALGHDWDEGVVTIEPTTTTEGEMTYTCNRCDATKTEPIPVVICTHNLKKTYAKQATCTKPGNSEYYTCTLCGKYFSDAAAMKEIEEDSWIIPALGHDYVYYDAKVATCTEVGWNAYRDCSRCSASTYQEIPALGHDMIIDPAVAATCTTAGKTEGSHCSRCDYVVAQQNVPALGHDMITDPAVAATCTTAGKTEGSHCSRCDYVVAQQNVPALGHDWDDGVVTIEPTETTEGEKTYTCNRCGATKTELIPTLKGTIPVDTDNDGIADTDVEAEPGEGLTYVDEEGNIYIPVDADGDGKPDFYVEVTENEDGDYPYVDNFGNEYIPVDVDGDGEPDVYVKVVGDEDNDGKPEDEAGNEYEGVDGDGDGDPDYWEPTKPNTIPVDTDNDGIADTDVEAEPGEGLTYVDEEGNIYIPVDSNGDGEPDFYVEVTENEDGNYPYVDNFGNEYIPVDVDGDGEPDVFVKVDGDEDNDGKPEDEAGNEYEGVDGDGDGDPDYWIPDPVPDHVYTPEVIQFNGYVYGTFYSCTHCDECYYEEAPECTSGNECPSAQFVDLNLRDWYHPYTDFAITTGMMRGTGNKIFEPHTTTSRAMVVMVLWNLENQPESSADMPFSDVKQGDWYYSAILWANENDIARGKGNGIFDPNGNVTRQELAAFIHRYAEWKGCDVSARTELSVFPDAGATSDWAVEDVQWAVAVGFIYGRGNNGISTLSPQEDGMRCEFATMMMRFVSNILMKPTWDRINFELASVGREPVEPIK